MQILKTFWFPFTGTLATAVLLLLFAGRPDPVHAQPGVIGSTVYVSGGYIPASLTYLSSNFGSVNFTVNGVLMVISNQDTATHTVTVEDVNSTPFVMFPALTVPAVGSANSTWVIPLGNTRFVSGLKWSTDTANKVMGSFTGTR